MAGYRLNEEGKITTGIKFKLRWKNGRCVQELDKKDKRRALRGIRKFRRTIEYMAKRGFIVELEGIVK